VSLHTVQFQSRRITDDGHARCYVPWCRKKRSCTLVWLGIEFISFANQWVHTTNYQNLYIKKILEGSWTFSWITASAWYSNTWKIWITLSSGEEGQSKSGSTSCMSRSHYFQMYWTFSPAHTHTVRCSNISQGIMETELLETLSPPNICPQWWKRITRIDSKHEDQYFCGGKLSTISPISSRRMHLSNKPITGSVASVCVLLGTGCYFLPIAWRTTTWKMGNREEHLHLRTAWRMDWTSCYLLSTILIP